MPLSFNLGTGQFEITPPRPRRGLHVRFTTTKKGALALEPFMEDGKPARPTDWSQFQAGDVVRVGRTRGLIPYSHYGIYRGDGTVIHYHGTDPETAVVKISSVDEFEGDAGKVGLVRRAGSRASEVLAAAESRLGERAYDLFKNNCQHFALSCAK